MKTLIRNSWTLALLIFGCLLSCTACRHMEALLDDVQTAPPAGELIPVVFDESKLGQHEKNVVYCTAADGIELLMDIYYPRENHGSWPVMIYVHGGGWSSGSKDEQSLFPDFTDLGVLGVSINYRLSPSVLFPAHIEDVKCAVRYLRAHAADYNLDPERILAIGGSAGGHLVSLLGTTGDSGEFNSGQYLDHSSAVQAVIAISAPTDLVNWACDEPEKVEAYYLSVFDADVGCGEYDEKLFFASPINYVNSQDVPFLLLAGTADDVVPYQQSEMLHQALSAVGVSSTLILVEGGDHGLSVPNHPERGEEVLWAIIDFTVLQLDVELPEWLAKE